MADNQDELQRWRAANPWFDQNAALQTAAIGIEAQMAAAGVPLTDRLAYTSRSIAGIFGDRAEYDARAAYHQITRADPKFAKRMSEDEYAAAARSRR
jgi:hypothetical protein